jgi:hypothetical protein
LKVIRSEGKFMPEDRDSMPDGTSPEIAKAAAQEQAVDPGQTKPGEFALIQAQLGWHRDVDAARLQYGQSLAEAWGRYSQAVASMARDAWNTVIENAGRPAGVLEGEESTQRRADLSRTRAAAERKLIEDQQQAWLAFSDAQAKANADFAESARAHPGSGRAIGMVMGAGDESLTGLRDWFSAATSPWNPGPVAPFQNTAWFFW